MAEIIPFDFQNSLIFFILLSLFSFLCYSVFFKKQSYSKLPPSPPSLPFIGHLHFLLSSLTHKSFQNLSSKYGPLLHLRVFNFPILLVSSAPVAYEVFRTHDVNVSWRSGSAIDESLIFGGSGIFTADYGDYWKFMKKIMVTKMFGSQAFEESKIVRADELKRFYKTLLEKSRKNEGVEIGKEAMKLTNNIICRMSMGRSCSEETGEAEIVRGLVTESFALTRKIFLVSLLRKPLENLGIPLFKKEIMDVSNRFDELLERILKEHEEKAEENQNMDMMSMLLATSQDKTAEYKISRTHIKAFFVEFFLGGTDTSAQTIQWIMAEIINNPKILEKLREENESIVGKTRLIQETDLPNLPYLQAVVKEGLRLHPPGTLLFRKFQESCKIRGFDIPENTTLVVNVYALMRDPNTWEDPNEFKPERFLASVKVREEEKEKGLNYLPFGTGRRGCPGASLAYIYVGIAIGAMVQCFDWRIEGNKRVLNMDETVVGLNLTMAHPFKCVPVPRIDPLTFNSEIQSS